MCCLEMASARYRLFMEVLGTSAQPGSWAASGPVRTALTAHKEVSDPAWERTDLRITL